MLAEEEIDSLLYCTLRIRGAGSYLNVREVGVAFGFAFGFLHLVGSDSGRSPPSGAGTSVCHHLPWFLRQGMAQSDRRSVTARDSRDSRTGACDLFCFVRCNCRDTLDSKTMDP